MSPTTLLWSGKFQGWLTLAGQYSTDITQARHFGLTDALAVARKHKTDAGYMLLPVRLDDVEAI